MPPQTILVTGANGLLGRPLAERLAGTGRRVVGTGLDEPGAVPDGIPFVAGDLCAPDLIAGLFDAYDFDAVVHLGGVSGPMLLRDDPARIVAINVGATANLIETAWRAGVKRFVYASSRSAYGVMEPVPTPETAAFRPPGVYGATKAAGDVLVRGYRAEHGLDGVALRIGTVYGPNRRTDCLATDMLEAALAGKPLRLARNSGRNTPFVYRDDVVTGIERALDTPDLAADAYNIGGPEALNDAELAALIRDLVPGADITVPPPDGPLTGGLLDGTRAARDLGYTPAYDMRGGLEAYIEWLRRRP
jgi:nucleoside-diphosphate-sugar epimerase